MAKQADRRGRGGTGAVVIVTGMSGGGKSSALNVLEDLGYEGIDNPPLTLLEAVLEPAGVAAGGGAVAVGVDIRTRDFDVARLAEIVESLRRRDDIRVQLLFIDCEDEVLLRRFTETRRRHPLAVGTRVIGGIHDEKELLAPLREIADQVLDTTSLSIGGLRREISGAYGLDRTGLAIAVMSFSYTRGLPREADLVFDVRFLRNPHYEAALRPLTGREPKVGAYIDGDPDFRPFLDGLFGLLGPLLPRYHVEGKSYLTIAVGCTGGKHRSVYVVERLGAWLRELGHEAELVHRDVVM
jgi:RNase adapter protein RapZ